jgi:SWI/SNF-related matrix-associated actin-dependent regulator of chromatin subfamily B protein 1
LENVFHILATDNNFPISFEKEILSQMKRLINFYKKYNKIEGDEILKTIKGDILIGNIEYKDQFEWDINNPENDPEEFARNVCIDLGLGNEFVVRITHSIREQILEYQKATNNERNNIFMEETIIDNLIKKMLWIQIIIKGKYSQKILNWILK